MPDPKPGIIGPIQLAVPDPQTPRDVPGTAHTPLEEKMKLAARIGIILLGIIALLIVVLAVGRAMDNRPARKQLKQPN